MNIREIIQSELEEILSATKPGGNPGKLSNKDIKSLFDTIKKADAAVKDGDWDRILKAAFNAVKKSRNKTISKFSDYQIQVILNYYEWASSYADNAAVDAMRDGFPTDEAFLMWMSESVDSKDIPGYDKAIKAYNKARDDTLDDLLLKSSNKNLFDNSNKWANFSDVRRY